MYGLYLFIDFYSCSLYDSKVSETGIDFYTVVLDLSMFKVMIIVFFDSNYGEQGCGWILTVNQRYYKTFLQLCSRTHSTLRKNVLAVYVTFTEVKKKDN